LTGSRASKLWYTLSQSMDTTQVAHYIPEIIEQLRPIDPARVILFGSGAYGAAADINDIDLLVVTQSSQLPSSHRERESIYLEVAARLRDIRRKVSMDLIVHTRAMHERFLELNSLFAQEVLRSGVTIYESRHQ
jgi:predicted nucleotidyltransferase